MELAAHSSPKDAPELAPHSYADHIEEAQSYGVPLLEHLLKYTNFDESLKQQLIDTYTSAIMLHDMGKLDDVNQVVLRGLGTGGLDVDHIDAGVAVAQKMQNELLAWLIRGHHRPGLVSRATEKLFSKRLRVNSSIKFREKFHLRGLRFKRDNDVQTPDILSHAETIAHTDEHLSTYIERQQIACGDFPQVSLALPKQAMLTRFILSCLVDADHESAACYSKQEKMPAYAPIPVRWGERRQCLDAYIQSIREASGEPDSQRNKIRDALYRVCSEGELLQSAMVSCAAPVGLGKTTAVIAYLLRQAEAHDLRRIIVIAPFTNIIDQTVKKLREAIVLEGENPEEIVAAHHHKADFSDRSLRQYSALWKASIVVTTAVQFFETLASAHPATLRKLNSLPGSAIFIDESHACLPTHYLRITWHWLSLLASDYGCKIVFSSGSLVEFWKESIFVGDDNTYELPDIVPDSLMREALSQESTRVHFQSLSQAVGLDDLVDKILEQRTTLLANEVKTPCILVIMNTVQSAAVLANALAIKMDDSRKMALHERQVLNVSTAYASGDRSAILDEVIDRQKPSSPWFSRPWFLVATSCVEAGVDLDFAVGFRERCSVTGFLQAAGRINRHGCRAEGVLIDFTVLENDEGLSHHPGFVESVRVFSSLWDEIKAEGQNLSTLSTRALKRELLNPDDEESVSHRLYKNENERNFQEVMADFRVIDSDTRTVIIDQSTVDAIKAGVPIPWEKIQENSVQLWSTKIDKLKLVSISASKRNGELYSWVDTYDYDPKFLGIMAGLIDEAKFYQENSGVMA